MSRILYTIALGALLASTTQAQEQKPPPFGTTRVEGTDNVYIFRYGDRQAMFVVTKDGVIATDPIGYGRPQAVTNYVEEIRKITQPADQVPDLQPPPRRPHSRRRPAVQGRRARRSSRTSEARGAPRRRFKDPTTHGAAR